MGKMSAEEMGILFAGISSILATLIYFTKNIKQSSCCGSDCKQVVTDNNGNVSTCQTTVTVEDNVAPEALCQPATVQLDAVGIW